MSRRGATAIRGILPIDKPAGLTSHDVVARIRRATGEGRVGHAGTLDPAATGLLVVLLGPYTRLEPFLSGATKSYEAQIAFGFETDTDDAEGTVTRTASVPDAVRDATAAAMLLGSFLGPSLQLPPVFSAIKVGGKVAHRAARAGEPLDIAPRPISVHETALLSIDETTGDWHVALSVSKGTYVRALARDLGRAAGSAAHLAVLRRTSAGAISIDDATPLDAAIDTIGRGGLTSLFLDPVAALGLPRLDVPEGETRNGRPIPLPDLQPGLEDGAVAAVTEAGAFRGIYRVDGGSMLPVAVMPEAGAA